ncbi:hypothetical protein L107_02062 [Cyanobium sp. Copco_Reservoir_LC18]|uniref:hypothetical protein n=1 Tax=Cyanobium sp. Copco_Reservoir_LC18 TaxID=1328305 RepID=UPI0013572A5E|nr:hypothetical protein [Cyanobium sp. Copco_Reservoir_LC18]KAF0654813.1 hypothetical protein L107_02062 [Cyanobium sp. Copco_Reservoir_LC18]
MLLVLAMALVVAVDAAAAVAVAAEGDAGILLNERDQYILRYVIYLSVLIGGGLGGFIYSISRNRGFIVPHWVAHEVEAQSGLVPQGGDGALRHAPRGSTTTKSTYTKYDLGTLADIIVGVGGGIIIFNLVPQVGDSDLFESLLNQRANLGSAVSEVMKILALSLIGGFAGISLFDEAAKRISRQLEETQTDVIFNRGKIQELQKNDRQESDIQFLLGPLLDPSLQPLSDSQNDALRGHVLKAPLNIRNMVFDRLQKAHDGHQITGKDAALLDDAEIETRMTLQQGLLAGFDALIDAAREQARTGAGDDAFLHRYLAHRGFVHLQLGAGSERLAGLAGKASQHWREAEDSLTQAIDLRDRNAADRQMYWHYSLQRMVARFKLGDTAPIEAEIKQPEVQPWLRKSRGIVHAVLKTLPEDFVSFLNGPLPELFEGEDVTPLQRIQRAGAL